MTVTRRSFLQSASTALALPLFLPGAVFGKDGTVAPSNRLTLAGIGLNHRGTYVLRFMLENADVRFVAIADVRRDRREAIKKLADEKNNATDCAMYRDFRELLQRDDIDCVFIATGDRWHTNASLMAAASGKDVYSEKPCCITIDQCRRLDEGIQQHGRIFQAGTQRRTIDNFQFAVNLARSGRLGKIHTVHASIYHLGVRHEWYPAEPLPDRDVFDWDMWLGPAPWRPFNAKYAGLPPHGWADWRGQLAFDSGAKLLDWGAHTVDLCQWAVNADGTTPIVYRPDGGTVYAEYADGVKLVMRPDGWLGLGTCPVRFEGTEGWVETGDTGAVAIYPDSLRAEIREFEKEGIAPRMHVRDFFDCVKERRETVCNTKVMRSSHIACHAAALAWMLGRELRFDPKKEEFIGDDEANRMRCRAEREPWSA